MTKKQWFVVSWCCVANIWAAAQNKTDLQHNTTAPMSATDYHFGTTVCSNSQQLFVGSLSNKQANLAGGVYVFDAPKQSNKPLQFIAPQNLTADSYFGTAIAAQAKQLLIGASNAKVLHRTTEVAEGGSAYLYQKDHQRWKEVAQLHAPEPTIREHFGQTVALSSQYALIAATPKNTDGYPNGVVYVYDLSTPKCAYQQTLAPKQAQNNNEFGKAILLNSTDALISAPQADGDNGAVYWFVQKNKRWVEQQKIVPTYPKFEPNATRQALSFAPNANKFGWAMALDQQTLAIGAPMENIGAGAVYIFEQQNGIWTQTQRLALPYPTQAFVGFGETIALQNNILWIGASGNAETPSTVYCFAKTNNQWLPTQHNYQSPTPNDGFGNALVATPNSLTIGAYSTLIDNMPKGAVYTYSYTPTDLLNEALTQQAESQATNPILNAATVVNTQPAAITTIAEQVPTNAPNTTPSNNTRPATTLTANNTTTQLNIYPNPSQQGVFYVQNTLDFATDLHAQVSTQQGSPIKAIYTLLAPNKLQIQLQNAPAGIYLLQLNNNNQQSIHKLYVTQP